MTKREEIDSILLRAALEMGVHLDVVKGRLSELGVVIKVDRELPEGSHYVVAGGRKRLVDLGYIKMGQQEMLAAGYVLVEPLIEEKK